MSLVVHPASMVAPAPRAPGNGQPHPASTLDPSNPLQDAGQTDLSGAPVMQRPPVQIVEKA
jgi:hypothetical protein